MWVEMYGGTPPQQQDTRAWRVVYVQDPSQLQRATPPPELAPEQRFAPCPVSFCLEWMLPSVESPLLEGYHPPQGRYLELLQAIAEQQVQAHDPKGRLHRLLGYDQPLQADVSRYLSVVSRAPIGPGQDASGLPAESSEARGRVPDEIDPREWRLLLQLDSDEDAGMQWVDAGSLFFCLRQPDLAARRFEEARGVVQFH